MGAERQHGKDIKAQIVGSDNIESGNYPRLESVWLHEVDELADLLEKATENGNNALYAYFESQGCPIRLDLIADLCERIIAGEIYLDENILDAQGLGEYLVETVRQAETQRGPPLCPCVVRTLTRP